MFDVKTQTGQIVPTVFSVRDEAYHKALKRPVAHGYSTSTLRGFESLVDECIEIFEKKLAMHEGTDLDFGKWLHWFAFDVISSITFSNRLGFMEKEEDVGGIIDAIEGRLAYNSAIGEIPGAHKFLLGNSVFAFFANKLRFFRRLGSASYIVQFAAKQLARYQKTQGSKEDTRMDMLSCFKTSKDGERQISDGEMLSHAASNMYTIQLPHISVDVR
jgi:Cytochrome P450